MKRFMGSTVIHSRTEYFRCYGCNTKISGSHLPDGTHTSPKGEYGTIWLCGRKECTDLVAKEKAEGN